MGLVILRFVLCAVYDFKCLDINIFTMFLEWCIQAYASIVDPPRPGSVEHTHANTTTYHTFKCIHMYTYP